MVCFFIVKVKSKVLDIYEGSFSNTVNYYTTNVALLILNETGLKKWKQIVERVMNIMKCIK
jgi:hemerythrin superfamily protein